MTRLPLVLRLRWAASDLVFGAALLAVVLWLALRCIEQHLVLVRVSAALGAAVALPYGACQYLRARRALRRARTSAPRVAAAVAAAFRIRPCCTCFESHFLVERFVGDGRSVKYACAGCERPRWAPAVSEDAPTAAADFAALVADVHTYRRLRRRPDTFVAVIGAIAPAPLPHEATWREPIAADLRRLVYERDGGQCRQCGRANNLQLDHIVPVARGGATTEGNIQLLCARCNQRKAARV